MKQLEMPTVCACCQRSLLPESTDLEHQESLLVSFRGGYGSVFGDGHIVMGLFCEECVQKLLGPYLTVLPDHPFQPEFALPKPLGAFQPNQLECAAPTTAAQDPSEELLCLFRRAAAGKSDPLN